MVHMGGRDRTRKNNSLHRQMVGSDRCNIMIFKLRNTPNMCESVHTQTTLSAVFRKEYSCEGTKTKADGLIGEWERANLVVQTAHIYTVVNLIYVHIMSCYCACVRITGFLTLLHAA